jgi:uncharacterized membrane protein
MTVMSGEVPYGPELNSSPVDASDGTTRRLELSRGNALTPKTALIFVATVSAGTFFIAGFFAALGFWPLLPFAGIEIALLIWAVRASMRAGMQRETITITEELVTVQHRSHDGDWTSVFPRHWVRVKLHAPPAALHPSRLMLESHGRACEVGRFLTEDDRRGLAVRLKQLVGNVNESPALR